MKEENKNRGMNTPEGYFDNFEDRMLIRVMEEDFPDKAGFAVPDTYFTEAEDRILAATSNTENTGVVSIFRKRTLLYAASIAACAVLVVTIFSKSSANEISADDLSVEAVEAYINNSGAAIDAYDVMAMLDEETLEAITIPSEILSEENLEDYIIENIDETSLLIE